MGLEAVELIMEVEEEFDVEISAEDAEEMVRVGDLRDWLVARCSAQWEKAGQGWCRSQQAFYYLRSVARDMPRRDARALRPSDSLAESFSPWQWVSLRRRIEVQADGLRLPDAQRNFIGWPVSLPASPATYGELATTIAQSGHTVWGARPPLGPDLRFPWHAREAIGERLRELIHQTWLIPIEKIAMETEWSAFD